MSAATVQPISAPFADARADQLRFSLTQDALKPLARTDARVDVPVLVPGASLSDAPLENSSDRIATRALSVDLAVLGTSHQVTVRDIDGAVLVRETLACLTTADAGTVPPRLTTALPGGTHTFTHTVTRTADTGAAARSALATAQSLPVSCAAGFPGDPHALTVLACEASPQGLVWRTWHCYPQAAEVVETRSVLSPSARTAEETHR